MKNISYLLRNSHNAVDEDLERLGEVDLDEVKCFVIDLLKPNSSLSISYCVESLFESSFDYPVKSLEREYPEVFWGFPVNDPSWCRIVTFLVVGLEDPTEEWYDVCKEIHLPGSEEFETIMKFCKVLTELERI